MVVPSAVAGLLRRPARLGDEVYSAIFSDIMALEIMPGTRISVDALARQLGVSQTPIREALTRLEAEGLVVKTHLVGYSAAPQLSAVQFEELYELRLLLEPFAASKAVQAMSDPVIGQLDMLCVEMGELAQRKGRAAYAQFAQLDMAFHDQIAAGAGNGLVADAMGRLHSHVHLFRLAPGERVVKEVLDEHRLVVSALRARDAQGAQAAMAQHIANSRRRLGGRPAA